MHGLWDWKDYFRDVGTSITGIAIKAEGESVNHSFRFIRRRDLYQSYLVRGQAFDWEVESVPGFFQWLA